MRGAGGGGAGVSAEVAPGIHRIESPLGERIVCCYLLAGRDRALLVDTAVAPALRELVLPAVERVAGRGRRIDVLVTHADFDHMGGNGALRALRPATTFACHAADAPLVADVGRMCRERYDELAADHGIAEPEEELVAIAAQAQAAPLDRFVHDGERIELGDGWAVEVLHVPGHSPGHVALFDPRSGTAIIGDAVMAEALPAADGRPAFPPTYRDVEPTLATVARLEALRPDRLLTGHYPVMDAAGARDFLARTRAFVERLDGELRAALPRAAAPITTRALVELLHPRAGAWPAEAGIALALPLMGHLERLEARGEVVRGRAADGRVSWARP